MSDNYGIKPLFITRGELGLPNYKCKDFAELEENYSEEQIDSFVKETLKYIQIKYERDNESDEDYIPY